GLVRLTAATCSGSPVCPTKKVSAILYTTVTRLLITLGTAIWATAFGTARLPINSFSSICASSLFPRAASRTDPQAHPSGTCRHRQILHGSAVLQVRSTATCGG